MRLKTRKQKHLDLEDVYELAHVGKRLETLKIIEHQAIHLGVLLLERHDGVHELEHIGGGQRAPEVLADGKVIGLEVALPHQMDLGGAVPVIDDVVDREFVDGAAELLVVLADALEDALDLAVLTGEEGDDAAGLAEIKTFEDDAFGVADHLALSFRNLSETLRLKIPNPKLQVPNKLQGPNLK